MLSTQSARVSKRVGSIAESATLAVDAKAKALKAAGEDVIGFGAGEPDFPTPAHIVEAAAEACRDPKNHKYTATPGLPELREAVAAKTTRDSGLVCTAANVLVTNGAKQAVYNSFAALLDPGDEVLMPAPYWVTYPEAIQLAGGVPVPVPTDESTGFQATIEALEAACTDRTKILLFVSPSNPTGAVYAPEAVEALGRWAAEKGLWVVTDEIYEHLVYGDSTFTSMPGLVPELADRSIVINGVAKTFAMTGWRVGWMIAPKDVIAAATNLQSHATSNVANVCQKAALAAVTGDMECVATMRTAFDRRRRKMHELLSAMPGVSCLEPQGAFYAFPSFEKALGGDLGETTLDLAATVLERAKVAIVPGEAFGAPGYARLSYALGDEQLEEGLGRVAKLLAGRLMARILVTEDLAERGLARMRDAGHDVDVRLGLTPAELLDVVPGAHALVIRSETNVTADVLAAGRDLVIVGRAGVGIDNVDVQAATRLGVMVANAPLSNVVSNAEHTMALLLSMARNVPQATASLKGGQWARSKLSGVELYGKTLGLLGLGRVGTLVAQRANAFGMRVVAWDPWISPERPRKLGIELLELDDLVRQADFLSVHLLKTPDSVGLINADLLAKAKPELRIINTARGGIIDEQALADAVEAGTIAGAAIDVFATEPTTSSPLFGQDRIVVTPHLGASTHEAQDKAGEAIADQVVLALAGDFVPYAVNVDAGEAADAVKPYLALAERLGRIFASLGTGLRGPNAVADGTGKLAIEYQGQLADYDTRILTLAVLKGLLGRLTADPVSYVNAPKLAAEAGIEVDESRTSEADDYVNLITVRSADHAIAGTLFGVRNEARLVMVDDHTVDIPPARHMLVVRNDDRPGMIGLVGSRLGRAGINISDMDVGRSLAGVAALMVLSTDQRVPDDLLAELRAEPGIVRVDGLSQTAE